jgi:hypothetical protein
MSKPGGDPSSARVDLIGELALFVVLFQFIVRHYMPGKGTRTSNYNVARSCKSVKLVVGISAV